MEQERTSVLVLQCECQPPSMGGKKTAHSAKPGDELFHLVAVEKGLDFKGKCKQINSTLPCGGQLPFRTVRGGHALAYNCLSSRYQTVKGAKCKNRALARVCVTSRNK